MSSNMASLHGWFLPPAYFGLKTLPSSFGDIQPVPSGIAELTFAHVEVDSLGYSGSVSLSATSSPAGLRLDIFPSTIQLASGSSNSSAVIYLSVTSSAVFPADYSINVKGVAGSVAHMIQVSVRLVPNPNVKDLVVMVSTNRVNYEPSEPVSISIFLADH